MINPNFTKTDNLYLPTRTTRRRIVIFSLLFCWGLIIFIAGWGNPENSLHQSLVSWSFFSWLGIVAAYVGGASWENVKIMDIQKILQTNKEK